MSPTTYVQPVSTALASTGRATTAASYPAHAAAGMLCTQRNASSKLLSSGSTASVLLRSVGGESRAVVA